MIDLQMNFEGVTRPTKVTLDKAHGALLLGNQNIWQENGGSIHGNAKWLAPLNVATYNV